jgi:hypothetical protein
MRNSFKGYFLPGAGTFQRFWSSLADRDGKGEVKWAQHARCWQRIMAEGCDLSMAAVGDRFRRTIPILVASI